VVQERGAREVPAVLLVHEQCHAGDREGEREAQPPGPVVQLSAQGAELGGAGEHHRLGPGAVGDHVDGRVGEEDHHRPHQDSEPEEQARPQVGAPGSGVPDVDADDRAGEQAEPEQQEPGREQPVDVLSGRLHQCSFQ